MKRCDFLKSTIISTVGLGMFPHLLYSGNSTSITNDALIGKQNINFLDNSAKLRDKAYKAFINMKEAALKEGITISAVSAYRSYSDQKRIWDRKYNSYIASGLSPQMSINKIVEYSTMPGTSRHHWGTDVDIIDRSVDAPKNVLSPVHFEEGGVFLHLKNWMDVHSKTFGFYLVYTDNPNRKGFKYEPWHYSYRPISCEYLRMYRERKLYHSLDKLDIAGAKHLTKDFLEQYYTDNILDINPELL